MANVIGSKVFHYYNEWDAKTAAWLRELIKHGHLPDGIVDERSITEVEPGDLKGFRQWHFFAGIGGWPLALRLAGWPVDAEVCTGSPPCQPFSVAGKQGGRDDPRHLAPAFLDLLAELRPRALFGEQVSAAVSKHQWLDALLIELEEEGYTGGTAVLPACSVGAPHKRDRIFIGAFLDGMADHNGHYDQRAFRGGDGAPQGATSRDGQRVPLSGELGRASPDVCNMANPGREQREWGSGRTDWVEHDGEDAGRVEGHCITTGGGEDGVRGVADPYGERLQRERPDGDPKGWERPYIRPIGLRDGARRADTLPVCRFCDNTGWFYGDRSLGRCVCRTHSDNSYWDSVDWLGCRDGKFRPVRPGTFPLANGVPARVVRLRGYGNAIVPQVAATFIRSFMVGAIDLQENI